MKKVIYSLLVSGLIALIFTSCERDRYNDLDRRMRGLESNMNGLESDMNGLENTWNSYKFVDVDYITIKPSDWMEFGKAGDENCYVFVEVDCPLITENVINNGVVLAYYVDENDRDNILPYIQTYYPEEPEDVNVTETFRYDAELGKITFKIQNSDFSLHGRTRDVMFKIATIF